jgi:bacterioferritin-associated ferredoxin
MVCVCFQVGAARIAAAAVAGTRSPEDIGRQLGAGTNCGSCIPEIRRLLANVRPSGGAPPDGQKADGRIEASEGEKFGAADPTGQSVIRPEPTSLWLDHVAISVGAKRVHQGVACGTAFGALGFGRSGDG